MLVASAVCFVWDTKLDLPTISPNIGLSTLNQCISLNNKLHIDHILYSYKYSIDGFGKGLVFHISKVIIYNRFQKHISNFNDSK